MKAVRFHTIGSPEVLRVDEVDKPKPGPGQALVEVRVVGVNFADTLLRRGTYISQPHLPETPGYEAAGIVEEVGQGVESRLVGQRVVALAEHSSAVAGRGFLRGRRCVPCSGADRLPHAVHRGQGGSRQDRADPCCCRWRRTRSNPDGETRWGACLWDDLKPRQGSAGQGNGRGRGNSV